MKIVGEKKLKTASELYLDEAVFPKKKYYSPNLKQNGSDCQHKSVQNYNKYTAKNYKFV